MSNCIWPTFRQILWLPALSEWVREKKKGTVGDPMSTKNYLVLPLPRARKLIDWKIWINPSVRKLNMPENTMRWCEANMRADSQVCWPHKWGQQIEKTWSLTKRVQKTEKRREPAEKWEEENISGRQQATRPNTTVVWSECKGRWEQSERHWCDFN